VVIYLQAPQEINFIKDILTKYADAPIKVFLGKDTFADAATYKGKAFKESEIESCKAYMKDQYL